MYPLHREIEPKQHQNLGMEYSTAFRKAFEQNKMR